MSEEQALPSEDAEETGEGSGDEIDEDDGEETGPASPEKRARHTTPTITGRAVTLQMLIQDNIIQQGEGVLSLDYLGQKFTGDLLANGYIKSNETEQTFATPSAWAIFCKNLVNPGKRSGCGWSSVKYKGRKLDTWKSNWFRQIKPRKPSIPGTLSPARSATTEATEGISESDNRISEPTLRTESILSQPPKSESSPSTSKPENITTDLKTETSSSTTLQISECNPTKTDSSNPLVSLPLSITESTPSILRTDSNISIGGSSMSSSILRNESSSSLLRSDSGPSLLRNESVAGLQPLFRGDSSFTLPLLGSPPAMKTETVGSGEVLDLTTKPKVEKPAEPILKEKPKSEICFVGMQEEALNLSLKAPPPQPAVPKATETSATISSAPQEEEVVEKRSELDFTKRIERKAITYEDLADQSPNIDQNILVECESFEEMNKAQPYTVSMSTNSLLVMDFHCHMTTSEVVGYLGGKWDQTTQHLSIQQAFPCRCRLGDTMNAALVEEEIRSSMKHMSMSLVGWYHSHPYCLPEPSVKDIDCQMSYQLRMKNAKSTYFPCVGIINSPYFGNSLQTAAAIQMYMVMPPPFNLKTDFGVPMELKYCVKQNHSISAELLCEIKDMVDFYRGCPDWIAFKQNWQPGITYLDKLKASLSLKLPVDQIDHGSFLDFVNEVLFTVLPPLPPIPT